MTNQELEVQMFDRRSFLGRIGATAAALPLFASAGAAQDPARGQRAGGQGQRGQDQGARGGPAAPAGP